MGGAVAVSICIVCKREFEQRPGYKRAGARKTCSTRCLSKLQAQRVRQSGYYDSMTAIGRNWATEYDRHQRLRRT